MTNTNTTPALVSALTVATFAIPAPRRTRRSSAAVLRDRRLVGRIKASLLRDPRAVVRAIDILFGRQTEDEQRSEQTRWDNARGFRKNHAKRGSELHALITQGRTAGLPEKALLRGQALADARGIAGWYVNTQLLELARAKAEAAEYEAELADAERVWAAEDEAANAGTLGEPRC